LDYVKSAPELGEFDDIGSFFILKRLIEEVEQACRAADISIGDGVAFGTRPELNPEASQLPVMETDASIISVNAPFLPLCNLTSKLLALTVETRNQNGANKPNRFPRSGTRKGRSVGAAFSFCAMMTVRRRNGWPARRRASASTSTASTRTRITSSG
jgi:hypothetical protein